MKRIRWSQFAVIVYFLFLSIFPRITSSDNDWNLAEDTRGWIDPHSMLETDPIERNPAPEKEVVYERCEKADSDCSVVENSLTECSGKVENLQKDLERQKELNKKFETVAAKEQPFFEQYLRHILGLFTKVKDGTNVGHYEADILLSEISYEYLNYYVTKQNASVQEVHSILLKMITNVRWMRGDDDLTDFDGGSYFSFDSGIVYYLNVGGMVAVIMVALLQVVSLLQRVQMSLSRFVSLFFFAMIFTCFVISVPWTWWHLYKKKVAERMAALSKRPPDCADQMSSFFKTFLSYFHIQTDECQKYYEQLEIDPLWEVPPTQAVVVTFVRFFLEPAKHIGQAIRELMVSAFEGLPIFLWLPVFAFILVLLILIFFCLGRYRISIPFVSIEPDRSDHTRQMAAFQGQVEQLQLENRHFREQLSALPEARGNAADERGDRSRQLPLLEETRRRVRTVGRHELETTDQRNRQAVPEVPRTLENISADSECIDNPALPCPRVDELGSDAITPDSSTTTCQPSPETMTKASSTTTCQPSPDEITPASSTTTCQPSPKKITKASSTTTCQPSPETMTKASSTTTCQPSPEKITKASSTTTCQPSPDEITPDSSTATSQPLPDEIPKNQTIAEFTVEKPPTVNENQPSASLPDAGENIEQFAETNEDLLQSYVNIETIFTSEDADLSENWKAENKPSTTDANTDRVEPSAKLFKNSLA